jgi:hypothetical protein
MTQAETAHGRAYERARTALRSVAFGGIAFVWLVSTAVNHIGHGGGSWQAWSAEQVGIRPGLRIVVWLFVAVLFVDLLDVLAISLFRLERAKREPGPIARAWLGLSGLVVAVGLVVTLAFANKHLVLRPLPQPQDAPVVRSQPGPTPNNN